MRLHLPLGLCLVALASCAGGPARDAHLPKRPIRLAVRADRDDLASLSTLSYGGGFETKTWLYETLIRRDGDGRLCPGLAESWRFDAGGTRVRLFLREGATFHDGQPCDAAAVCEHFKRWIHRSSHAWLGAGSRILRVEAEDERTVLLTMAQPYALLADLCATNPCAIAGPGSYGADGTFETPIGSGPFRYVSTSADGANLLYERVADGLQLSLVRYGPAGQPVHDLLADSLDAVVDGWIERIPRDRVEQLQNDPRFVVDASAGSSVVYLSFRTQGDAPTALPDFRRRIAAAIDRRDLCDQAERGHADPCFAWAAPAARVWPRPSEADRRVGTAVEASTTPSAPVRLLLESGHRTEGVGLRLAEQLRRAGIEVVIDQRPRDAMRAAVDAGEFELRLEETWGLPYDPLLPLRARFLPPPDAPTAATYQHTGLDQRLIGLIERASSEFEEDERQGTYRAIQSLLTREALVVPLLVPHRLAVMRREVERIRPGPDLYRLDVSDVRITGN